MNRPFLLLTFSCISLTTSTACFVSDYTLPTVDPNAPPIGGSDTAASSSGGNSVGGSGGDGTQSSSGGMGGQGGGNSSGMGGAGSTGGGGNNSGGSGGAGGMPTGEFCDNSVDSLLACFRFEDPIGDESGKPNIVSMSNVGLGAGQTGTAGNFEPSNASYLRIDSADHWNVTEFTVEMWVYLRNDPITGARMGLFDSDGRYGFFIQPGQLVRCTRGSAVVEWSALPLKTWTHVACKLEGASLSLHINGINVAIAGGAVPPDPNSGVNAIGGNAPNGSELDGFIDNFRAWNIPRTDKQICEAAGVSGC